jgi:hypothetical protein
MQKGEGMADINGDMHIGCILEGKDRGFPAMLGMTIKKGTDLHQSPKINKQIQMKKVFYYAQK